MSSTQISSVASDVLQSYRKTSFCLIEGYRGGSSRLLGRVDARWAQRVNERGARLSPALREALIAAGQQITGYYAQGIEKFSDRLATATEAAYDFADAQVRKLSERAGRFENAFGQTPLRSLAVVGLPSVRVAREVAEAIATQAECIASRVAGIDEPALADDAAGGSAFAGAGDVVDVEAVDIEVVSEDAAAGDEAAAEQPASARKRTRRTAA